MVLVLRIFYIGVGIANFLNKIVCNGCDVFSELVSEEVQFILPWNLSEFVVNLLDIGLEMKVKSRVIQSLMFIWCLDLILHLLNPLESYSFLLFLRVHLVQVAFLKTIFGLVIFLKRS